MKEKKAQPRPVDFFTNDEDYQCCILASLGFSNRYIMGKTKLSGGQITYRLKKASIKRVDYRDGTSDVATLVMQSLEGPINKVVITHLKDTLL